MNATLIENKFADGRRRFAAGGLGGANNSNAIDKVSTIYRATQFRRNECGGVDHGLGAARNVRSDLACALLLVDFVFNYWRGRWRDNGFRKDRCWFKRYLAQNRRCQSITSFTDGRAPIAGHVPVTPAAFNPAQIGNIYFLTGLMPKLAGLAGEFAIARSVRAHAVVHTVSQTWVQIGRNPLAALGNIAPNIGSIVAAEKFPQRRPTDIFPTFLALNSNGAVNQRTFRSMLVQVTPSRRSPNGESDRPKLKSLQLLSWTTRGRTPAARK
jgi:hypothetical protein